MAETLVKFKSGSISDLAEKKTVDSVEYPAVPLDSGTVYFVIDDTNTIGQIVYDYALDKSGQSINEWNASTTYAKDAEVLYQGKFYKSFVASNKGHAPFGEATSYDYWREIAARIVMTANSKSSDLAKRTVAIPYAEVDSTSTATAFTATIDGITELTDGLCILLKNGVVTSAAATTAPKGFTININNLGAKYVYSNMATGNDITPTNPTLDTTIFNINYTMLFVYSSTITENGGWICYHSYDSNTNTLAYQVRTNSSTMPASDKGYRYRLWFTSADGKSWVPANKSTSTNATAARTPNTRPIDPFGEIIYYSTNGTTEAGANLTTTTQWQQYTLSLGYSFNTTGAALVTVADDPVYVKCTPQADGSAVLVGYTQSLPSTEDGYIYIYLGVAYNDAGSIELKLNHPVYYYKDGAIRLWTNGIATETDPIFTASAAHGITSTDITNWNNKSTFSGNYNDLSNKPTIPTVPTNVSAFTNDSGYITSADVPEGASAYTGTISAVGTTASSGTNNGFARGDHVHNITSSTITSALGFTPYNSTNPDGFISSYTETDPVFAASAAHGITSTDITNWNNKQDAETGKGLSTNDYTTTEKNKLAGIASGAEANVQSNWNETNSSSDAYIQNKPTAVSAFTNDAGYLTSYTETDPVFSASAAAGITSSDISTWNGKQDALVFNTAYNASSNKVATMSDVPTAVSDLENDANYMSGMTILSYGTSTWNDFITAYKANHVVYCRASSNANPASGSQTRMAFMAYVSNADNPTNVEFQYYRSVSSHSATQQGDQVYVYKLTNANSGTWTVETREAYTKVVAGTNMTSSYSNGTLTLNANSQAPTITNTLPSGELIATINSTNIYAPSYTAGTGISITNGVISLNLTQAESENF